MSASADPAAGGELSAEARRRFERLAHAGVLSGGQVVSGEAGARRRGTQVRFDLRLLDGRIAQVRFLAYGCPHTLAACEWLAERIEADGPGAAGEPRQWAAALQVPESKLGRLLVIEDALRMALQGAAAFGVK